MNNNELIFKELQSKYPSLANVSYASGQLIFSTGILTLNEISLQQILPSTFNMSEEHIFLYLAYGLYKENSADINQVFSLFPQLVITEDEENFLKNFTQNYVIRQTMYNEETPILSLDPIFISELEKRQKVIVESFKRPLITANIIAQTYTDEINKRFAGNKQNANNSASLDQGMSLARTKKSEPALTSQADSNLGIGGFTTILIIIMTTIIAGIYIAWKLMY